MNSSKEYLNYCGRPMTFADYLIRDRLFAEMHYIILDEYRNLYSPVDYPEIQAEGSTYIEAIAKVEDMLMYHPRFLLKIHFPHLNF